MKGEHEKVFALQKRTLSAQSHRLNKMLFGGIGSTPPTVTPKDNDEVIPIDTENCKIKGEEVSVNNDGCNGNHASEDDKKSSVGGGVRTKPSFTNVRNSLCFVSSPVFPEVIRALTDHNFPNPSQNSGNKDSALNVPLAQNNNSAGVSNPGPYSTFTVGVWEDKNKKCRRTMEDTHAFLYNFLQTPAPVLESETLATSVTSEEEPATEKKKASPDSIKTLCETMETDNGYFAIFDGHAGTFAADWCGRKLHIILEDLIRKNPEIPIPEILDKTFTSADSQLEKLPLRNSGCTAVTAILRWEDRILNPLSSKRLNPVSAASRSTLQPEHKDSATNDRNIDDSSSSIVTSIAQTSGDSATVEEIDAQSCCTTIRQRILYTANVGDARVVLCRKGKALRLSYDHKGSDENEGKRITSAGGLILNNRVNGVLAVTRALGDNYMKDLVTGHPYTTETVIRPDMDEFIILACDGLWDVCSDQEAVNLIRDIDDPTAAAKKLVDHALAQFSTDNLSCLIVRFSQPALSATTIKADSVIGDKGNQSSSQDKTPEPEKIVEAGGTNTIDNNISGFGVIDNNVGRGHESNPRCTSGEENEKEQYAEEDNKPKKDFGELEDGVELDAKLQITSG